MKFMDIIKREEVEMKDMWKAFDKAYPDIPENIETHLWTGYGFPSLGTVEWYLTDDVVMFVTKSQYATMVDAGLENITFGDECSIYGWNGFEDQRVVDQITSIFVYDPQTKTGERVEDF